MATLLYIISSHWNSNFEVMSFVGCHTSRVAYWDSKTHGEGISSVGLTSFELWPKNCKFFLMKNAIFWLFLQYSKYQLANYFSRLTYRNSKTHWKGFALFGLTTLKKMPKNSIFHRKNFQFFGHSSKLVSPIELIPSPWVLEF